MAFKKHWMESIVKWERNLNRGNLKQPDEISSELRGAISSIVNKALQEALSRAKISNPNAIQIQREVFEQLENLSPNQWQLTLNIENAYRAVFNSREGMLNDRKQELQADIYEATRGLFFLVLRAISIAAVILLTGYLANKWGIPLPLLRLV